MLHSFEEETERDRHAAMALLVAAVVRELRASGGASLANEIEARASGWRAWYYGDQRDQAGKGAAG